MFNKALLLLVGVFASLNAFAGSIYLSNQTDGSIQIDYVICQADQTCDKNIKSVIIPAKNAVLSPIQAVYPFQPGTEHATIVTLKSVNNLFSPLKYFSTFKEQQECLQKSPSSQDCRPPLPLITVAEKTMNTAYVINDGGVPNTPFISARMAGVVY